MIISLLLTLVWTGFTFYLRKNSKLDFSLQTFRASAGDSLSAPLSRDSILFFTWFLLFLLLPLFWGLTFWLHSDANVVVVVATIIWGYNWVKYVFEL